MAFDITAIQVIKDTSFTDIIQGKSYSYNRSFDAQGLPQQVHITQKTTLVKDYLNASNSAIREVTPMELEGIFKDLTLRDHNKKAYDFFLAFEPNQVVGNKYDKIFKLVEAIEKKKTSSTTSTSKSSTTKKSSASSSEEK